MFLWLQIFGVFLLPLAFMRKAIASAASNAVSVTAPAAQTPMRLSQVDPFSFASLMQLILGLALVIGLILLLAWLLRRFGGAGFASTGMKIVATLPLSARERVVLVEIGEKQVLLGVAPGRVNLLASYDEAVLDAKSMQAAPFSERLKDAMARRP